MKSYTILLLTIVIFLLSGCSSKGNSTTPDNVSDAPEYLTITSDEAKKMMDDSTDIIILDVRTVDEYNEGHIKDAILLQDADILDKAEIVLTDKASTILVYCRSGRRSAQAAEDLASLGYTNIYDFGGIIDWEYDIVK
ncbi:MAG TPA: rhodanese-like domain-containing protein [Mobilitalea sp.]|nr:rhodanese-like domain-containing protein [Mobilitalea sp.]